MYEIHHQSRSNIFMGVAEEKEKCSDASNQLRKWVDSVWTSGKTNGHVPPVFT